MSKNKLDNAKTESLIKAVLALRNAGEAKRFFRDLLSEAEIHEFANRWLAAKLLHRGVPYTAIRAKTGLSTTTIARVSKWLQNGKGGFRQMLKRFGDNI